MAGMTALKAAKRKYLPMHYRQLVSFVVALFLSIAVPASAHDLAMGSSRWTFGNSSILGFIDLISSLLS